MVHLMCLLSPIFKAGQSLWEKLTICLCLPSGSQPQVTANWEAIILLWVVTPWLPEKNANVRGQRTLQESPRFSCQFLLTSSVERTCGQI